MRPDQLPGIVTVSAPSLHPGGEWAVVATGRPDFDVDAYVGQLWRIPLKGVADTSPRRITRGRSDTAPRISPDGRLIAFLRNVEGMNQLALVDAGGGEPMVITDRKLGVVTFCWSPDSTTIAFLSADPAEGRYGTLDDVGPSSEDPRRITGVQFMSNGVGYLADKRTQLFAVAVPPIDGEPPLKPVGRAATALKDAAGPADAPSTAPRLYPVARQLTHGDADHRSPCFSADGSAVIVAASLHPGADLDLASDLYAVPVAGGEPRRLTESAADHRLSVDLPCVLGERVFFLAGEVGSGRDFVARNVGVFVVPIGGGTPTRLTDAETVGCDATNRLEPAGDGVLAIEHRRGYARVLRVSDHGVEVLLDQPVVAKAAAWLPDRDAALITFADAGTASEVGLLRDGSLTPLTDFARPLREQTAIVRPSELTASAPDGYPVHGWTLLPPGEGPHPVLLLLHGGPFADFTGAWFDEAQVYVSAGYGVLMCNPRGSLGYGQVHGRAIKGDFGNLDMADILAFLDHALATVPGLDAERIGVIGGSYGGFMTAWLIAHDPRWKGAIVERGYLDPASFVGSSDIGWMFGTQYNGDTLESMNRQSPMLLTGQVSTPTLVLHSEQDLRCPLSQALRYYTQLKLAGVDAELLVFPGETHELSRSGTPWHRRQRFEAILDWWNRHLPVG